MNVRVLRSISQNPSTVSMNASKLLVGINRSYSHIYLAKLTITMSLLLLNLWLTKVAMF